MAASYDLLWLFCVKCSRKMAAEERGEQVVREWKSGISVEQLDVYHF